jgi:dTDP-4-dehydrorhamnose reductase
MRILILGASGLIGHKLLQELSMDFEVFGTLHKSKDSYGNISLFSGHNIIDNVNVAEFEVLKGILYAVNPDIILNCVGITKRKDEINDSFKALTINSVFPHQLAIWAKNKGKRIIHFSTDCVFDGKVGNYDESSLTTAEDIYGRTKALGEIRYDHTLTIRSSFIGQELFGKTEFLEWLMSQKGKQVKGFRNTLYSGVSTIFMARVVRNIILNYSNLSGLYQLAPEKPISKYDLICIAKEKYNLNVDIVQDDEHVHFPTLNGSKLRREINLIVPSWKEMMTELSSVKDFYLDLK